jgi:hypothetical protein
MLNYRGRFYLSAIVFNLWRFTLPEFRIAGFRSKIHTIAIIKFCHIKKNTVNHALLKLSHMNNEIVVKFIYNLSI